LLSSAAKRVPKLVPPPHIVFSEPNYRSLTVRGIAAVEQKLARGIGVRVRNARGVMHDIHLIPHHTDWWVLNGKVRQGPYNNLKLASRIAFAGRSSLQRVVVLNEAGAAIMYWPKAIERVHVVSGDD
jgi:hypothetical protein